MAARWPSSCSGRRPAGATSRSAFSARSGSPPGWPIRRSFPCMTPARSSPTVPTAPGCCTSSCPTPAARASGIGWPARARCRWTSRCGSPARWRRPWATPTGTASSTGTSSRRTSCSRKASRWSPTSVSRPRSPPPPATACTSPTGDSPSGTPAYMSPEQATAEPGLDGRCDQYSLACVLYEMLAGDPPFAGTGARATMARHAIEAPAPIGTRRPNVPVAIERALARALAKEPVDRYPTDAGIRRRPGGAGAGDHSRRRAGHRARGPHHRGAAVRERRAAMPRTST